MKAHSKNPGMLDLITDWQAIETDAMSYVDEQTGKPENQNTLTKTFLRILKLEAEKRCLIQQAIVESKQMEAPHLSPDELATLSAHLNRQVEREEEILPIGETVLDGEAKLLVPRYLLFYLLSEIRKENSLLKDFDDELKTASIPTSATSRIYAEADREAFRKK
ncbi:MAG: hypothetical protein M0018_11650 [Nitrospiraceae bacterium]|nr:hypothetical protein [Nitrospiraceae bacterium]